MELLAGIYKHYKGGYYQALGIGAHSETDERLVVYISVIPLSGGSPMPGPRIRLRPVSMWNDLVKWPDGDMKPRFVYIGQELES